MKKFVKKYVLFAAVISCLLLFGCAPSLETEIEAFQSELPMYVGDGMTITKCLLNGNMLEYVYEFDESDYTIDDEDIQDLFKEVMAESKMELLSDDDLIDLLRLCKQESKGVRFKLVGAKSHASFVFMEFSPTELQSFSWL